MMQPVICPVCQEPNPVGASICQKCQANLTGLAEAAPLDELLGALPVAEVRLPTGISSLEATQDSSSSAPRYARLLAESVRQEGAPDRSVGNPLPMRGSARMAAPVVRLTLLLALVALIMVSAIRKWEYFPLPEQTAEAERLYWNIESLAPGAMTLVAIDYEPGFSGEMEQPAREVIQHLMEKKAYLIFVSTLATGPFQIERLVKNVEAERAQPYSDYINFGYLPGGSVGLAAFAASPQKILETAYGTPVTNPWDAPPLSALLVQGRASPLQKIPLILVITESPDRARDWIEQIRPLVVDSVLNLVLSAQAEPALRPYFDSAEPLVNGVVVGLSGAVAYAQGRGRAQGAADLWGGYGSALIAAGVLFLLAGGYSLASARPQNGNLTSDAETPDGAS